MENVRNIFDSFKEFIWDIIGYFLPGAYLLILLSTTINEHYFYYSTLLGKEYNFFIFIILSYLLGYVIYGIGLAKESLFKKMSFKSIIETEVSKGNEFLLFVQYFDKIKVRDGIMGIQNLTVREYRNIAMGTIPEADQKVYTFTFRSELANHIGNISFILGTLALVFWVLQSLFNFTLFRTELKYLVLYFILIISFFILKKTRDRFYKISIKTPFSIFIAKRI